MDFACTELSYKHCSSCGCMYPTDMRLAVGQMLPVNHCCRTWVAEVSNRLPFVFCRQNMIHCVFAHTVNQYRRISLNSNYYRYCSMFLLFHLYYCPNIIIVISPIYYMINNSTDLSSFVNRRQGCCCRHWLRLIYVQLPDSDNIARRHTLERLYRLIGIPNGIDHHVYLSINLVCL